ncbi:MAG: hypothetical protein LQ345_004112 [Seirophora villosa]|nr:MAG: hypothetical protein LQ345_004112 [Seirophora villosa]
MHHFLLRLTTILLSSLIAIRFSTAAPAPSSQWRGWDQIDRIFVFGASYAATGYNWLEEPAPSPQHPLGNSNRCKTSSNGPNFATYLTTTFNASKILTYNFAFPGASVDERATHPELPQTDKDGKKISRNDLVGQIDGAFIPHYTPNQKEAPKTAWSGDASLFISFFGINDILSSYRAHSTATTDRIMASYAASLDRLYAHGARNFLLLNTPPLPDAPYFKTGETASGHGDDGLTPSARAEDRRKVAPAVADLNSRFPALAAAFQQRHPDATLWYYDTHALFARMMAQPALTLGYTAAYGLRRPLRELHDSCEFYTKKDPEGKGNGYLEFLGEVDYRDERCEGGSVGEYFWLSALHPTWAVHKVLAGRIVEGLKDGGDGNGRGGRLE